MNSWKEIWNKRRPAGVYDLADLIKFNGFDSEGTSFNSESWERYVNSFQSTIPIGSSDSIFEFGCGCGAFLIPFYEKGHTVGGIDYSEVLIGIAKISMAKADLQLQDVMEPCKDKIYDLVLAHSVFQYFESLEFAKAVCCKMLKKSSRKVAILDVPNKRLQKESEHARSIAQAGHQANKSRDKLSHLYYEKQWFEQFAIEEKIDIKIFDQAVDGYINSKYRFNVIMTKL